MKRLIILLAFIAVVLPKHTYAQELGKYEPQITISNVTSVSFTVSWFSDGKADQALIYGTQEPLDKWEIDDRGIGIQRESHHITLKGLSPSTEYSFRINNQGKTYKQKTAPILRGIAPLPEIFKGTVINTDKAAPEEGIVYMKIEGAQVLSTTTKTDGTYRFRTRNIRRDDLLVDFLLKETNFVIFFARAGYEGEATKQVFAYARPNPIDLNLQEVLIPFYKIKFPDEIFSPPHADAPPTPAPTTDPATGVSPASDEGFFGIFWKRVREIF